MKSFTTIANFLKLAIASAMTSTALAAPGYVARPATLVKMPFKNPVTISYLLEDALKSAPQKHDYEVQLLRKDPKNPGKMMRQAWPVTLVVQDREEPDAPVASHLLLFGSEIYELGEIDIGSVEVKEDTIILTGSAGYSLTSGAKCGHFAGAHRTIVIKFVWNEAKYSMNAFIQSQKDTPWCD